MAQHGYLGDGYGTSYDPDWDDERERERDWRGPRERSAMFQGDDDRFRGERPRGSDVREWFGGDGRSDWERAPRNFSSSRDDHYRSWRDKQMQALDRDYEEYCREREQQFHHDFDSWRQDRRVAGARFDPTVGSATDPQSEPQSTVDTESAATLGTETATTAGRRKS
jgi:hypothetical protein